MNKQEEYDRLVDKADFLRIKQKEDSMFPTEFIDLTELWQDGEYNKVGEIINNEKWNPARVAEFSAYMCKYLGITQFNLLYKFL